VVDPGKTTSLAQACPVRFKEQLHVAVQGALLVVVVLPGWWRLLVYEAWLQIFMVPDIGWVLLWQQIEKWSWAGSDLNTDPPTYSSVSKYLSSFSSFLY
jgi:hypothetical protein